MDTRLLFVHALSPLHAGTGQSVGAVDLAIARDRATDHPYLPGSSLKGSLRARSVAQGRPDTTKVFGPESDRASDHAGVLIFGDANLLLLPVRSVAGTFAWVTSRLLLAKYARDAREAGIALPDGDLPAVDSMESCRVTSGSTLRLDVEKEKKVVFEDLDFTPEPGHVDAWATHLGELLFGNDADWKGLLTNRLCVVHDDVMTFLARHGTDVVTRVMLDNDKKTVKDGHLWTEENLPVETVLVSLVGAQSVSRGASVGEAFAALGELTGGTVQLGGKATVGRGRCRLVIAGGAR